MLIFKKKLLKTFLMKKKPLQTYFTEK